MLSDYNLMKNLIEYEFYCSKRYRRYFTILFFTIQDSGNDELVDVVNELIKESDCCIQMGETFSFLFSETDKDEVLDLLCKYTYDKGLLRGYAYSLIGYPEDGKSIQMLMTKIRTQILMSKTA